MNKKATKKPVVKAKKPVVKKQKSFGVSYTNKILYGIINTEDERVLSSTFKTIKKCEGTLKGMLKFYDNYKLCTIIWKE